MPGLSCNACNKEFKDDSEQKSHYKSEWHRYNLKRKVAGVPGVTEPLFLARLSALAQEKKPSNETPMLYTCGLCAKGYRSSKAHSQHLQSRGHLARLASQGSSDLNEDNAIIKPLSDRVPTKLPQKREKYEEESDESEWEEVDVDEELVSEAMDSLSHLNTNNNDHTSGDQMDGDEEDDEDDGFELDPSCCFMCDSKHDTIDNCMVHMHKKHGFFIPDVEYLKDPEGLLTYLSLRVKRDFMCLYCNERCHPFSSLEAVRKHMSAKSHCKVHFGDGGEEEEAELEEFYDYSSSYVGNDGKHLVGATDESDNTVELGTGGSELIITRRTDDKTSTKMLGSREYLQYYRQKPRPSPANDVAISLALASRYRSMGLSTVQSKEHLVRIKVMKEMNRRGVEAMRSKIGMKSNIIRNLPNNVPY